VGETMDEIKKIYSIVLRRDKKAMKEYVKAEKRTEKKKVEEIRDVYAGMKKLIEPVQHEGSLIRVGKKYYGVKQLEKAMKSFNQNVK
jgi:hypothetical protein